MQRSFPSFLASPNNVRGLATELALLVNTMLFPFYFFLIFFIFLFFFIWWHIWEDQKYLINAILRENFNFRYFLNVINFVISKIGLISLTF